MGKHVNALSPERTPSAILWGIIATDLGIMADTVPKLAIALLVNKVLAPSRLIRSCTIMTTALLICLGIALVAVSFVSRNPPGE